MLRRTLLLSAAALALPTRAQVIDLSDAINKAGIGVSASIVSDGSDTPYHLVLTSTKTGATSSMKITVADANAAR